MRSIALLRPTLTSHARGFEVADEADQRRQDATRLVAENPFDLAVAHTVLAPRRSQPERRGRHE
jgi:hypothetical protein